MLLPDDAILADRNTDLPGLRLVLDAPAMAERMALAFPSLHATTATASYVRFKRGTSCLVGYRLSLADATSIDAYARTQADPDDPKLAKIVGTARRRAQGRPASAMLEPVTGVTLHPYDHDLPALVRLVDPPQRSQLLARALDCAPVDGWALSRLRYKPERRWVGRLVGRSGDRMLVKVHRSEDRRRAVAAAEAFARLPVPAAPLLGVSRRHNITLHRWVEGISAVDGIATSSAEALSIAQDIGMLLARLHAADTSPAHGQVEEAADEGEAVMAAVAALADLDRLAGDFAGSIAGTLRGLDVPSGSIRPSLLHGDCSIDQVVLTADGPMLVDVDRAVYGDPHIDLAQLLADLARRSTAGELQDDGQLVAAIMDGYCGAGGTFERERLTSLTAARLIRLAPEPFRHRHENWRQGIIEILDRAARVADVGMDHD